MLCLVEINAVRPLLCPHRKISIKNIFQGKQWGSAKFIKSRVTSSQMAGCSLSLSISPPRPPPPLQIKDWFPVGSAAAAAGSTGKKGVKALPHVVPWLLHFAEDQQAHTATLTLANCSKERGSWRITSVCSIAFTERLIILEVVIAEPEAEPLNSS